jgi:hypothetical protein
VNKVREGEKKYDSDRERERERERERITASISPLGTTMSG